MDQDTNGNGEQGGKVSRRQVLQTATAVAVGAVAFPDIVPAAALGRDNKVAPSERITLGIIGTGNQGTGDMRQFLNDERVQVVAVCDVNRESAGYWNGGVAGRDPAKRIVEEKYAAQKASGSYKGCDAYNDFREVLGRKDIDAVEIATPDHWHAIPVILAAKAGKDIYCQKPLSLTIEEGRAMSDAVKKHKRVFQTGSQQRSDRNFRRAAELVRNGRIGKVHTVRCGMPGGRPDFGKTGDRKKPEPVPEGFDYDFWLGPAREAPYAPARCHVNFRWIYDYYGGQVTDWGGHHPDCAQWGLGTDHTGPVEIRSAKAAFPRDPLWDTATDYYFEAIYADGVKMIISNKEKGGVTWEGANGWVWADRGRHDASTKEILNSEIGANEVRLYESNDHFRNFIDCVISRKEPVAPVEVAHRSITICHLGNIALRLGRESLKWDPAKERIVGDPTAATMLGRDYRAPWTLPKA
uniref:Glycosyl hydrolase family 109 protein n=1 Tax=uncultured Armatimonadetes bacterium TaxID=157466 RepID=A0A6J4HNU0_9BACT|nr:GH109 [uncultured Armatimonadetes bacterium]